MRKPPVSWLFCVWGRVGEWGNRGIRKWGTGGNWEIESENLRAGK